MVAVNAALKGNGVKIAGCPATVSSYLNPVQLCSLSPEDEKNGRGYYKPGDLPFLHVDKYFRGIVGQLSGILAVADVRSNRTLYLPTVSAGVLK